ncbi:MAG: serine/threonine protein kinase [Planctomycetes bacterium]|nr:serine/threonine protein kinase [Planctomycetota bacterium]
MSPPRDPLRVCQHGCLLLAHHVFCPWHGTRVRPLVGLRLGNHRIERPLSTKGGFGAVYLARNVTQRDQEAAIKVLKPPHCYRPNIVKTFIYESGLGKGIQIGQIPKISDVAESPWPHIKMEFIVGSPLEDELRELRQPARSSGRCGWQNLEEAHGILIGIAKALQASHQVGLIHRDLKPLNVLLVEKAQRRGQAEDWVKVIDWGIAMRILDETDRAESQKPHGEKGSTTVEFVNKIVEGMGSLPYMAPEHFQRKTGKYSDIYQFGIIAFEILTGQFPYKKPDENTVQAWHNIHSYQRPRNLRQLRRSVPRSLARVVHRCLEKDPARRYPDGEALLKDVARKPLPRSVRYAMAALLVAVVSLGIYLIFFSAGTVLLPSFFVGARGLEAVAYENDPGAKEEKGDFEKPRCFWLRSLDQLAGIGAVTLSPGRTLTDLGLEHLREGSEGSEPLGDGHFAPAAGSDNVELRFDRIGEFLKTEYGEIDPETTRKFVFAPTGRIVQGATSEEFRHRFALAFDGLPPRVSAVRITPSWEPKPANDLLLDSLDAGGKAVEVRLYAPAGAIPRSVTLSMTVAEENLASTDGSYVRPAQDGQPLGVEISYRMESETRHLTPPPASRDGAEYTFEVLLPDLPEPSPKGGERRYEIRVTDKAQNQVSLTLDLVLDSGLAASAAESLTKLEEGKASLSLTWNESYDPAREHLALRFESSKDASQSFDVEVAAVERSASSGEWNALFALDRVQLQRIQESPDLWYLLATVREPLFGGAAPAPEAQRPLRVVVERDREMAIGDFADRVFLSFDGDATGEKKLHLIPYPRFEDAERMLVFETETAPSAIRIWQLDSDIAEHGYAIHWKSARFTAPDRSIDLLDRHSAGEEAGRGRYLALSLEGLIEEGSSLRCEIELKSLWGVGTLSVPVTVQYTKRLPRFFDTSLQMQKQKTEALIPESSVHVNGKEELRLVTRWRPTYQRMTVRVQGLSGDEVDSRPIEAYLRDIENQSERVFTHVLVNRRGEPLGEGIYNLAFDLEDIFGNKETYQNNKVFSHGPPPLIEIDECQGEECEVRKGKEGSRFVARVDDKSGISRIRFVVEGKELFGGAVEALLEETRRSELEAAGILLEQIQRPQSHLTSVRLVYTDWKVGERKTIEISAWDHDVSGRAPGEKRVVAKCTSEMLPAVVPWKGLDWIRIGGEKELESAFYICRVEVSRGQYGDFDFYADGSKHPEDSLDDNLPVTDIEPAEMWEFARRNGCYLPTYTQWKKTVEGGYAHLVDRNVLAASLDGNLKPEERDFIARLRGVVHHPETTSKTFLELSGAGDGRLPEALVPVGREAEDWKALIETAYPGLFHSVLHLLGNAQEVVLRDESPLERPEFQCIGGSYRARLHNFLDPLQVAPDDKRSYRGLRLIVLHESRTEKAMTWEANEQFQAALQKAQSD